MSTEKTAPTVDPLAAPTFSRGTYRHYKGGLYDTEGVAHDSTNATEGRWLVLYRSRETGILHARELSEFTGVIERGGAVVARFALVTTPQSIE